MIRRRGSASDQAGESGGEDGERSLWSLAARILII
jgi:hypothetical protein